MLWAILSVLLASWAARLVLRGSATPRRYAAAFAVGWAVGMAAAYATAVAGHLSDGARTVDPAMLDVVVANMWWTSALGALAGVFSVWVRNRRRKAL
jgi:hypothetical protein